MEIFSISIVGLGKLGASMAAAIASRGFDVIGVDVNPRSVELLNAGRAPVQETDLEKTIVENQVRLRATQNLKDAIFNSQVTFVIVPTPSDGTGAFSLKYAAQAFRDIGTVLAKKDEYHTVVLASTVLPGATRYGLLPILEQASGKVCGQGFGLCYSPEFIALGSVIRDFLNPDFTLIGEYDTKSGTVLESCYARIMENNPPCQRMSLENAELTKISVNTFVTTKITFANMLSELCSQIPGGDVDVVSDALGLDKRIGRSCLTGGLGYGGPCFPRDNVALSYTAKAVGVRSDVSEATDALNRNLPARVVKNLKSIVRPDAQVAVLGLSYKPASHVIEESQGIYLAKSLLEAGANVVAFDPLVNGLIEEEWGGEIRIAESIEDCLSEAEVVLITTPDPIFRGLKANHFVNTSSLPVTVVDFWRILQGTLQEQENINYVPIGKSLDEEGNAKRLSALWEHTQNACAEKAKLA